MSKSATMPLAFAVLTVVPFLQLSADSVILNPAQDNSIFQDLPDNSSGAGQFILAGVTKGKGSAGAGQIRRGLISFDIAASLPAGATLNSAVLQLTIAKVPDESTINTTQFLHRATSVWGSAGSEGTGKGEAAQTGDATWTANLYGSSNWTQAGGDFLATASAAPASQAVNTSVIFSDAQLAQDVQLWLDQPTLNFGWFILGNEAFEENARGYYSSENAATNLQPKLILDYSVVPEPKTYALWLGILGLSYRLMRRSDRPRKRS